MITKFTATTTCILDLEKDALPEGRIDIYADNCQEGLDEDPMFSAQSFFNSTALGVAMVLMQMEKLGLGSVRKNKERFIGMVDLYCKELDIR